MLVAQIPDKDVMPQQLIMARHSNLPMADNDIPATEQAGHGDYDDAYPSPPNDLEKNRRVQAAVDDGT
ncbi:MAG: hypothetical protein Kow00105_14000 [Phycisphaeraceae bacterium]